MSKDSPEETSNVAEFDDVFKQIKSFGRYQQFVYWTMSLTSAPNILQFMCLIFSYGAQKFHCVTPNVTCSPSKCCDNCTSYSFDEDFSAVSEWDLICDRAYISALIQSTFFWGMLLGSLAGGWMSDKFGRKKCVFGSLFIMSSNYLGTSFVSSPIVLCILQVVAGFSCAALLVTNHTFTIELVGPKKRTMATVAKVIVWKMGGAFLIFLIWLFSYWRHLVIFASVWGFLLVPLYKIIPESPRWLVAHGQLDEAEAVLMKFGAKRKKTLDRLQLRATLEKVREVQLARKKRQTYHVTDMFRTPRMRKFTLVICFNWFVVSLVFFAMYLYVTRLFGNVYINTGIMNLTDIPALALMWLSIDCFGRRITYSTIMALCGVVLIVLPFVQDGFPKLGTALAIAGKCLMSAEFELIYLYTTELFPTVIRNISMGTGSTTARIGATVAPFFVMMAQLPNISLVVPLCLFGGLAMVAALLSLMLPETLFKNMEQTIEEAEKVQLDYNIPCCRKKLAAEHIMNKHDKEEENRGQKSDGHEVTEM